MKKLIPILLLAGSLLAGCGDSQEDFVFTNTGNVAVAPIARNDAYTTVEDTAVAVPAGTGVLANDTLNALNNANVTVTFPNTTTQGGTVTLAANTGAFTYTPAAGFVGNDTFVYTLSNGFATATATVTITVTAVVPQSGFFVDSVNGNDATGDFATGAPFQTIQAAVTAAGAGEDIVVRPGNYTGTINLLGGQRLLGSGSVLAQGELRPELTGPIVLADGNTLDFLRIEGSPDTAVDGDGQNGATVTNCEIIDAGDEGISGDPALGNWTVEDNEIVNAAGIAVLLGTENDDDMVARVNRNTITGAEFAAISFLSAGSSELRAQVNDNVLSDTVVPGATFESIAGATSTSIFQIIGNENDDTYIFGTSTTGQIDVENFGDLETLNTGDVVVSPGSTSTPNDIEDAGF